MDVATNWCSYMKIELTDLLVKSLKPGIKPIFEPGSNKKISNKTCDGACETGKAYDVMDRSDVKGFGVRVLPSGVKTFILLRRFPGSSNPTRRALGIYKELIFENGEFVEFGLEMAREEARKWNAMVKAGIDPADEIERKRRAKIEAEQSAIEAERVKLETTLEAAFTAYFKHKSKLRSIVQIERDMRREFRWLDRPLSDITTAEVKKTIRGILPRGSETAKNSFRRLTTFFKWAIATGDYDLAASPCAAIDIGALIGDSSPSRELRELADVELAAYWRAAEAIGYPFGPFFKLLALSACRRNEVARASWAEFDLKAKLWVIPASRMKGRETGKAKAREHAVPLTPAIFTLLESLPRFNGGDFLFSADSGKRPVCGFSVAKERLDAAMRADLEAQGEAFKSFTIHDIRRTCRTRFSALRI